MAVSSKGKTLLTDPWLTGSCYWRSWWNYPPVRADLIATLKPDAIYLTHVHWDHFHGVTLKRFSRNTKIIIPYERSTRLARDLEQLGFTNVVELAHAQSVDLAPDFRLTSYQFSYWGDSALVIETENVTLLNANDAKFMGWPLDQILNNHPTFDFAFRSHSSANDRLCWRYTDSVGESPMEDPRKYTRSFFNFMERVQPRYAIPFASNHCHLHRDVYELNSLIQTPYDVEKFVESEGGFSAAALKIMVSGDSWDSETGFHSNEDVYFSNRANMLELYRNENIVGLENTYRTEERTRVRFAEFERCFKCFRGAVPRVVRQLFKGKPIIFRAIAGQDRDHFLFDLHSGLIAEIEESELPTDAIIFETTGTILKHAMAARMFSHIGISKRVVYRTSRANAHHLRRLNNLLAAYEYEVLPLRRLLSLRTARVYVRRWRELFLYVYVLLLLTRKISMHDIENRLLTGGSARQRDGLGKDGAALKS